MRRETTHNQLSSDWGIYSDEQKNVAKSSCHDSTSGLKELTIIKKLGFLCEMIPLGCVLSADRHFQTWWNQHCVLVRFMKVSCGFVPRWCHQNVLTSYFTIMTSCKAAFWLIWKVWLSVLMSLWFTSLLHLTRCNIKFPGKHFSVLTVSSTKQLICFAAVFQ